MVDLAQPADNGKAGSGPRNPVEEPLLASSLPATLAWSGTQIRHNIVLAKFMQSQFGIKVIGLQGHKFNETFPNTLQP
jgi:hypothetical protein